MSVKVLEKDTRLVHQAEKTVLLTAELVWITHCGVGILDNQGIVHAEHDARVKGRITDFADAYRQGFMESLKDRK